MLDSDDLFDITDPFILAEVLWPDVTFYKQQVEIIESVWYNDETYAPAGNKLGKDFVAGFICLAFFLTRRPCRIVTTSAKDDHLRVLWGEIGRFIQRSKYVLDIKEGGMLLVNHQDIRRVVDGKPDKISYILGMVAAPDKVAAMQGHHANPDTLEEANDNIPRTLFVCDESSSVPDDYYPMAKGWAKRMYIFGNTWPCENFWKKGVERGDVPDPDSSPYNPSLPTTIYNDPRGQRYYQKVIRIRAQDSPNVRFAQTQIDAGQKPTNEIIVPGVKDYAEYKRHRATLNELEASVILDAEFYKGAEIYMFPTEWLIRAQRIAISHKGKHRTALGGGCDPAEGGDKTSNTCCDMLGFIAQRSKKTPDTSIITGESIAFMREFGIPPDRYCFDRGGGGKQHADILRAQGIPVRTVAFGESLVLDPKRGMRMIEEKIEHREEHYEYTNRRAEMYGELRKLLDPALNPQGFGIPPEFTELIRQLSLIPLTYDGEGRMFLLPKNKKGGDENSKVKTLKELIGCSPDEADSAVLAVHGMLHKSRQATAGGIR